MTIIKIIISMSILLLGGCTFTPHHNPPNVVAPKTTRSHIKIVDRPPPADQVMWWKKMHDPVLNHLIRQALANNNQLQSARMNILQAQAQLQAARFAWLPTLNASGAGVVGGGWDSQFTPQGPLASSRALSNLGNIKFHAYFGGFVPQYSLNILANIYQNKFAKASLTMQQAAYQSTRISIISQISGAYFMLLGQREQLKEQAQYITDLKKLRQLEWVRYKDGASDLTTVTDLDNQIESNQANLVSIENSIAQVENSIQILLNCNPAPIVSHGDINKLDIQGLIPKNLSSTVLKNRPDILIAEQNLKMSQANVGTAYSNYFPTISLTSLLGSSSIELVHLLTLSTGLWVAEAAATIPILNGVSYEQIKSAKAGYLAAYYNYIQTLRSAFANVDNSLTNQQKMNKIYHDQFKALLAMQKKYALALARYKAGARDYRDVANTKLSVDSAKITLTLAKMQQLDSIVEVYQALAIGCGCSEYICTSPFPSSKFK